MRKVVLFIVVLAVLVISGCKLTAPASGGSPGEGSPADGSAPPAPEGFSLDGESPAGTAGDSEGTAAQDIPSAEGSQLPPGASTAKPALFPADWTSASPFPICPAAELTLSGISYLEDGQLMVSFYDPNFSQGASPAGSPTPPMFLELTDDEGDQVASYDCTKHPSAPDLIYCFGDPIPAGSQVKASLAVGDRASVIIYDPAQAMGEGSAAAPGAVLAGRNDLDGELLFPAVFGLNRDYLAGIWGTNGTSLDPEIDFIFATQAAVGFGFSGEIKTLIGLFNVLSACQVASDLGAPLPDGCDALGAEYYQPQTDCQGFPGCYQACTEAMSLPSPDGESSLGKKELLDYLDALDPETIPAPCLDYQYWSRSVLFTGSSDDGDGAGWPDSVFSPISAACVLNPDSFICGGESGDGEDGQAVESIPVEFLDAVMTGACMLDPGNPLCRGEFGGGGSEDEVPTLSTCAADIAWPGGISTYSNAADLMVYLLSVGPSLDPEALPASCQSSLEESGSAFQTGLAGMLSGVVYSGTVNSCVYQASFIAPPRTEAGGSGGGQSGSGAAKPSCGPGLIAVLWQGNWICIPEN